LASHSSGLVTPAGDAPIQHVENERADHQDPRGIKPAWVPVAHMIHGKEDSRGTAAAVRKCEEIGQMKTANHREVTRTKVWRSHCDDVTRQSGRGRRGSSPARGLHHVNVAIEERRYSKA